MPINTGQWAKLLYPGLDKIFGMNYSEHPVEHTYLFDMENSKRAYEEVMEGAGLGLASVKAQGDSVSYDETRQSHLTRFKHVVYGLGFIITREMIEDDLYGVVAKKSSKELAFSMRQTKETVLGNIYNRAFNSSYTGGDGVEMISNAHVRSDGTTYSNRPSSYTDLSEAALEEAAIDIMKFTDTRGKKISVMPKSLIIPVDLCFEAERILKTDSRVGTADNDLNALKTMGTIPMIVKNHYLTDTDAWFIRTNVPGLTCYNRRATEFTNDSDFDTENAKFKATERYSAGWFDPRAIYGSQGA